MYLLTDTDDAFKAADLAAGVLQKYARHGFIAASYLDEKGLTRYCRLSWGNDFWVEAFVNDLRRGISSRNGDHPGIADALKLLSSAFEHIILAIGVEDEARPSGILVLRYYHGNETICRQMLKNWLAEDEIDALARSIGAHVRDELA